MDTQGVLLGIYLLLFVLTLGNFLTFHHDHLLSLTNEYNKVGNVKNCESLQLRSLRSIFQQVPEIEKIPLDVIKRIVSLKLHKKIKRGRYGGLGRVWLPTNGINNNNLITVAMSDSNICEEN